MNVVKGIDEPIYGDYFYVCIETIIYQEDSDGHGLGDGAFLVGVFILK